MDTMGALALGTEPPTPELLERKPYKRNASLLSRPMWRNIACQAIYQIILQIVLLYKGAEWFQIRDGEPCARYKPNKNHADHQWDMVTHQKVGGLTQVYENSYLQCSDYIPACGGKGIACLEDTESTFMKTNTDNTTVTMLNTYHAHLHNFHDFEDNCLVCTKWDYVKGSIIFNTFIFCQFFNEYTARKIFDELNMFHGVLGNYVFLGVSIFTLGAQIFLIEVGGDFLKTSPLNLVQWFVTIGLGAGSLLIGVLMRFIPIVEDPNAFFDHGKHSPATDSRSAVASNGQIDMMLISPPINDSGQQPPV